MILIIHSFPFKKITKQLLHIITLYDQTQKRYKQKQYLDLTFVEIKYLYSTILLLN